MYGSKYVSAILVLVLLNACASWAPGYEQPQINLTSFALAPDSNGLAPRFLIGLQVINPNRQALPLQGMSYSVEVEGNRIFSGAEPDLPRVEGYSSADIVIEASPDLLGSARLFNQLLSGQQQTLDYLFKARFDIGALLPYVTIEERGEFGLEQLGNP
ncbi:MAG: LEA type 2 family protein [Methylophaga sp.]|nr:LEA type 2 family protein [Methylophaga sp.]